MGNMFWHFAVPLFFVALSAGFFVSVPKVNAMNFNCEKKYLAEKHTRVAIAILSSLLGALLFSRSFF